MKLKKLKLKDYDQQILLIDAELARVHDEMAKDITTEKRGELRDELGDYLEQQQTAIRNRNEYLSGLVPEWLVKSFGVAASTLLSLYVFGKVMNVEVNGEGVFSGQAINIFDKVVRKF